MGIRGSTSIFNFALELEVALYQKFPVKKSKHCKFSCYQPFTLIYLPKTCIVWSDQISKTTFCGLFLRENLYIFYIYFGAISIKYHFKHENVYYISHLSEQIDKIGSKTIQLVGPSTWMSTEAKNRTHWISHLCNTISFFVTSTIFMLLRICAT